MIRLKQLLTEKRTPWGMSDSEHDYGNGIKFYGTPSHGGIYVPSNLVNKIDPAGRAYAKKWSGSENWYEEDIGWLWVVVAFPQLFKPEEVAGAKKTIAKYGPNGERLKEEVEIHKLSKADQQATGQKFYFSTDDGYWGYANSKEEAEAMAQGGRKQDRARDRRALKGSYKSEAGSSKGAKKGWQSRKQQSTNDDDDDEGEMFPTWEDPDMGPEEIPVDRTTSQWKAMNKPARSGKKSRKEGWNADQWKKAMDRTNKWKQANPALANAKRAAKEKDAPWLRKQKPLPVPAKEGVESGYTKKALMRGPDGMYLMCPCGQKVTISGEKNVCGCGTEFNATGWIKNPKMTEAGDPMSTYRVIERPSANRWYVVDGKGNPAGFWEYKGERSRENARKAAEKKAAEWTGKHSPSSFGLGDKPTIASLEKEDDRGPESPYSALWSAMTDKERDAIRHMTRRGAAGARRDRGEVWVVKNHPELIPARLKQKYDAWLASEK